jgi:hypothetical protein
MPPFVEEVKADSQQNQIEELTEETASPEAKA